MIIQHNIMAMNAYRNYMGNTNALSKNLEKLSSGYRINRAGDDAAGLAISEKMRAQITGLDAAQKNVQDGISLVQTAEGALQEVQDMLNRMTYLATQSANGTYDNEVDRANLQKDADSANFNGIALLDGSLTAQRGGKTNIKIDGMDRVLTDVMSNSDTPWEVVGAKTIYDSFSETAARAAFKVDLDGLTFKVNSDENGKKVVESGATLEDFQITIGDLTVDLSTLAASKASAKWTRTSAGVVTETALTAENVAKDVLAVIKGTATSAEATINGVKWAVTQTGSALTFTQKADPSNVEETKANFDVVVEMGDSAQMFGEIPGGTDVTVKGVYAGQANRANTVFEITADDIRDGAKITLGNKTVTLAVGRESEYTGTGVVDLKDLDPDKIDAEALNVALSRIAKDGFGGKTNFTGTQVDGTEKTDIAFDVTVSDGSNGHPVGLAVQRAAAVAAASQVAFDSVEELAQNFKMKYSVVTEKSEGLTLQIGDNAATYNQLSLEIEDLHVKALGLDDIDISTQKGAQEAVDQIKEAINSVSMTRGTLGATQNRLEHTANNLSVMEENIQDAESAIRDTDVAEEMMAYTKNNILIQSAQAMLAQANTIQQGALQLLQ